MGEGKWKHKNQEVGKGKTKTFMSFEELDDAMKRMARERAPAMRRHINTRAIPETETLLEEFFSRNLGGHGG